MANRPSPKETTPEISIRAGKTEAHYWGDLWHFRELLFFLVWRDIKVRYAQAVLGVAWAVIQPAVQTVLLTFVFGRLAKMPSGDDTTPYFLIVVAGLLPWQLFSAAFSNAGASIVGSSQLISKVYFPRLIIPVSGLGVALCDFFVAFIISIPLFLFFGPGLSWPVLFLPILVLFTLVVALGAGLWITALTVRYRDFRFISPFILQFGLFLTPVGFRSDLHPAWRDLLSMNPMTGVVEGFRWCLLQTGTPLYLPGIVLSVVVSFALFFTGLIYFRRTENTFADVI
jgi:lipopolysaccharide transport system permease protein